MIIYSCGMVRERSSESKKKKKKNGEWSGAKDRTLVENEGQMVMSQSSKNFPFREKAREERGDPEGGQSGGSYGGSAYSPTYGM